MTPSDFSGPKRSDLPDLRDTIIVAAFEGWNDAGDAASDALEHLDAIWEADTLVEIDDEAMEAFRLLCQEEGIIPAIESSHALAGALKLGREAQANGEEPPTILVSLSGRGDKDVETAMTYFGISGKGEQR